MRKIFCFLRYDDRSGRRRVRMRIMQYYNILPTIVKSLIDDRDMGYCIAHDVRLCLCTIGRTYAVFE